jgi:hydrogenase expression/formation protein HypC
MCLAVPLRVLEIHEGQATCGYGGIRVGARLDLLDDVAVGDWVLVHAGFAIAKVDPVEAEDTWALLAEVNEDAAE